ncbi:putative Calreticulin [Monocercomonoides exilis]|uniref:putative Calreticulin n=1 Tax=Monocercomonoides exilis TaxID=2049356 RepID=UPI0035598C0D|nr:putative Calreticulin [Monocercomonoides exilis]|eukprot:MONOS_16780.1-p1 / transcript=MONOS_16780.1 / gene=MONOS_16780 / organism=Monocercomonoides_exilis_PA203 / gene_product=Calreticulin / transcript_product=Calreticulin / location=Mono_scaffold00010:193193-194552(-) / protein_length=406 / sequence_SO=supercontig / SO=protein_coding / is_pseudo=false
MLLTLVNFLFLAQFIESKIYFKEEFDKDWASRWVISTALPERKLGKWGLGTPPKYHNKEKAKGLKTFTDHRHYLISADMGKTFSNEGKTLILSYSVMYPEYKDCEGAYIKLLPEVINQEKFNATDPYYIMFGPDICGRDKNFFQFVIMKNQKAHPIKKIINSTADAGTHLYTLFLHFENYTYEIFIDEDRKYDGKLWEDFDFMEPPMIPDPDAKQPDDWETDPDIPDPTDKKPMNWDQPMVIPDPTKKKPYDWDEATEGPWVQPMVKNPRYKGKWVPRLIYNPKYKGEWKPPLIPNPKYAPQLKKLPFKRIRYIGFDLWQVTAGTLFDNIFVGDDVDEYKTFVSQTWELQKKAEKGASETSTRDGNLMDVEPENYDDEPIPDDTELADEDIDKEDDDFEDEGISI